MVNIPISDNYRRFSKAASAAGVELSAELAETVKFAHQVYRRAGRDLKASKSSAVGAYLEACRQCPDQPISHQPLQEAVLQAAAEQYAESAAWRAWTAVKETATQEFDKITEVWRPGFRKLATTLTKTMTALALPDLDERHMAQVLSQGGRAAAAWNEAHEAAAQLEMVGLAWMALAEFVGREAEAAQNWNLYGMPRERMVKVKYLPLWGVDAPTETWDAAVRAANKANRRVGVDELAGAGATLKLATWAEYEARARDYIYPPTEDTKDVA